MAVAYLFIEKFHETFIVIVCIFIVVIVHILSGFYVFEYFDNTMTKEATQGIYSFWYRSFLKLGDNVLITYIMHR